MTTSRAVTFILGLLIAVALYAWLDYERNNLVFTTRSLIGQVRKGGEPVEQTLYVRKRFPEGSPYEQELMFAQLTRAMHASPVKDARYGKSGKKKLENDAEATWRDVEVECENGDRYTVQWVRWRANWYIYDFRR